MAFRILDAAFVIEHGNEFSRRVEKILEFLCGPPRIPGAARQPSRSPSAHRPSSKPARAGCPIRCLCAPGKSVPSTKIRRRTRRVRSRPCPMGSTKRDVHCGMRSKYGLTNRYANSGTYSSEPARCAPEPHSRGPWRDQGRVSANRRSEEHTSELQSHLNLVCRLLLEKKKNNLD